MPLALQGQGAGGGVEEGVQAVEAGAGLGGNDAAAAAEQVGFWTLKPQWGIFPLWLSLLVPPTCEQAK